MDGDLDVEGIGDGQAVVDGRRRGAPVLVELEAHRARAELLLERLGQAGVALPEEAEVHRKGFGRLEHPVDVPGARGAGRRFGARRRPSAAAEHGGDAAGQRLLDLLRADEVDVSVDGPSGEDLPFAGDDLRRRAQGDVDPRLHVGIARLADGHDASVLDADVRLHDAPVVDDERVGDHQIDHLAPRSLALTHAIADHFSATEFHLVAVDRPVLFDLDPQLGVGEADAITHRRPIHRRVLATVDAAHWSSSSGPMTSPRKP